MFLLSAVPAFTFPVASQNRVLWPVTWFANG